MSAPEARHRFSSEDIPRVVSHAVFFQQGNEFLVVGHLPVMRLLIADIADYRVLIRGAYAEEAESALPGKIGAYPSRGAGLDLPDRSECASVRGISISM